MTNTQFSGYQISQRSKFYIKGFEDEAFEKENDEIINKIEQLIEKIDESYDETFNEDEESFQDQ